MNKGNRIAAACVSFAFVSLGIHSGAIDAHAKKKADASQSLVGVWKLVSTTNTKDGVVNKGSSFGPTPNGRIIFTPSGHYSSVNTHSDMPKFASGNRLTGTAEENKLVVQRSNASFGTYTVSPDMKSVSLKQEGGTWALRNGTTEKRALKLDGDTMSWTTAATVGGTSELVYKRIK